MRKKVLLLADRRLNIYEYPLSVKVGLCIVLSELEGLKIRLSFSADCILNYLQHFQ